MYNKVFTKERDVPFLTCLQEKIKRLRERRIWCEELNIAGELTNNSWIENQGEQSVDSSEEQ
jgi:hypothetical protein